MAKNPSNRHGNRNTVVVCAPGKGKGIAVTNLVYPIPQPIAICDPSGEYQGRFGKWKCNGYTTRRNFVKAFESGWSSRKPFCISYFPKGKDQVIEKEWFAKYMHLRCDGDRILNGMFEEFGRCSTSNSSDDGYSGKLVNEDRKFGFRGCFVAQRSTQIPKDIWSGCDIKIVGEQTYNTDAARIMDQFGCTKREIAELGELNHEFEFYIEEDDNYVLTKTHYLMGRGMGRYEKVCAIVPPNAKLIKKWNKNQKKLHQQSEYKCFNAELIKNR